MSLCSAKNNLTVRFAFLDIQIGNLYYRNDKDYPDGLYIKFMAKNIFGVNYEEMIKYCKFIFVDSVGIYHKENDSYSGGYGNYLIDYFINLRLIPIDLIGLVQQSKVDSFARLVDYNLEDKFYFSDCALSFNYFATQTIERKMKNNNVDSLSYLLNFLIPSIEFSSLLIGSLIYYFGFLFFITKFKLISKFVLKLLTLFFVIYLFLIENLFNSNINTSNVIVNTSDLINDVNDVIKTKRELCVFEKISADNNFFFKAPEYSFASKLNKKINHNNLCYLSNPQTNGIGNILIKDQNRIFIFTYDIGKDFIMKMIQTIFKRDLFVSQKPIFENLKALILSKKSSIKLRNLFNKFTSLMLENGVVFTRKHIPNYSNIEMVKFGEFITFDGIQNYIEHFAITEAISYEKLDYLFKIYFAILISLIFIFLIHYLVNLFHYFKKLIFLIIYSKLILIRS